MTLSRSLRTEIATAARSLDLSPYPLYGSRVYPKDRIKRDRTGGDDYEAYRDLLRDPHLWAVIQKRWLAVIEREWEVIPGGKRAIDKKAADGLKAHLDNLAFDDRELKGEKEAILRLSGGFDQACYGLLQAIFYGYAIAEILWDSDGKEIYPKEIRVKQPNRFTYLVGDLGYRLRLLTPESPLDGIALPTQKFITHVFNPEDDNPYGWGLGSRVYWAVQFKRRLAQFSLNFADKYGMPPAIGTYPANRPELRDALLAFINSIAQEAGGALPEGVSIEFPNVVGSGGTDLYQKLMDYFDREISKAVLGETGSTDQQGSGGSRARDQIGNEVRIEIAKADADLLSDTLNRTLCQWVTRFNFPDAKPPQIWRKFPELEEKQDLNARATRDEAITRFMGTKPTRKYVEETYGIELEEEEAEGRGQEAEGVGDRLTSIFNSQSQDTEAESLSGDVSPETALRAERVPPREMSVQEQSPPLRSRSEKNRNEFRFAPLALFPAGDRRESVPQFVEQSEIDEDAGSAASNNPPSSLSPLFPGGNRPESVRPLIGGMPPAGGLRRYAFLAAPADPLAVRNAYNAYHSAVNMTYSQLKAWSETEASRLASLDRSPIERNLHLLSTPKSQWGEKEARWAKKAVAFISRMRKAKGSDKPVNKEVDLSKRQISLKNWGYDNRPVKQ